LQQICVPYLVPKGQAGNEMAKAELIFYCVLP
jgi:hypothetical protein